MATPTVQQKDEGVCITIRIPTNMMKLLEEELRRSTHFNLSEFVRDAIRKELERRGRAYVEPRARGG